MSILVVFVTASIVSYLLRILFVTIVPADRLPDGVQRGLAYVGPAAMATLATVAVLNGAGQGRSGLPLYLGAVAVAALVARWRGGVATAVVAAVAVAWVLPALLPS